MPLYRRLPKRGFTAPRREDGIRPGQPEGSRGPLPGRQRRRPRMPSSRRADQEGRAPRGQGAGRRGHRPRARGQDAQDQRSRPREAGGGRRSRRGHPGMIEGLQSFQNIAKVPELKRRVLVTLGLLAAYRLGAHVPTPGIDGARARGVLRSDAGHAARHGRPVLGREPAPADRLRARHHAVHLRLDHPAAPDGGHPLARAPREGGRGGEEEDHAVHALRHDRRCRSSSRSASRWGSRACGAAAARCSSPIRAGGSAY